MYDESFDRDILALAYYNTVEMLKNNIRVIDDIQPKITKYMFKKAILNEVNNINHFPTDSSVECFLKFFFNFDEDRKGLNFDDNEEITEWLQEHENYSMYAKGDIINAINETEFLYTNGIY